MLDKLEENTGALYKLKIKQNVLEAGKLVGADYIITGSLQNHGKKMRIRVNLLTAKTGEVLITKSFESDTSTAGLFEIQDQVVQEVVAAVGGYYGINVQEMSKTFSLNVSSTTFTKLAINR